MDRVVLMTIHSAKGLEFKNVYLSGLEENLFPSKFSTASLFDLEEERRLFYVAITRAEKKLCISYARKRYRWGDVVDCMPSRFIGDINPEFIEMEDPMLSMKNFKAKNRFDKKVETENSKHTEKPYSSFKKSQDKKPVFKSRLKKIDKDINIDINSTERDGTNGIEAGVMVEHQRFGKGKVLNIEGDFPNIKATIEFNSSGKKQLLLKFAKLKILK